ncbi:MAG: thiamine phosphate synthase, partial [Phycisphaerales bacterium]
HHQRTDILRMIDANLNRASEGIRVLEDCARFALDDPRLSESCKTTRHRLRAAAEQLGLPQDALIAARDTGHDVGTTISTPSEADRADGARDLAAAAAKRATEALRVIEECAKAINRPAHAFESIRYGLYTLEQQIIIALRPPCPQWRLCVLITRALCTHYAPTEIIKAADGGADCIQIREKDMPDGPFLTHAAQLTACARDLGLHTMINDRAHIARLAEADGVHLGRQDLPIDAARAILGPRFWIGRTCPTIDYAIEAVRQGADTCGVGPMFPSTTKPKPESQLDAAGPALLKAYLANPTTSPVPVLAISGINQHNIDQLASIGCPGVAVSSAVCSSTDPRATARAICDALDPAEP